MKLTIRIFTIYMFVLSLIPCGDGGGGFVELVNHYFGVEHQHISDHKQHSNSCGDDTCSPFCICSCCSTTISAPEKLPFQVTSPPPIPSRTPSFFSNINPSSFFASIWQPPRFS